MFVTSNLKCAKHGSPVSSGKAEGICPYYFHTCPYMSDFFKTSETLSWHIISSHVLSASFAEHAEPRRSPHYERAESHTILGRGSNSPSSSSGPLGPVNLGLHGRSAT